MTIPPTMAGSTSARSLDSSLATPPAESAGYPLDTGTRSAATVSLALFACTLVSLAAGYLMYRKGQVIVARAGLSLETLRTIAEMEWFFAAVNWTAERAALILEEAGSFFEERRSPGWIMVFATVAALLLLSS